LKVTPSGKLTFIVQGRIGRAKEVRLSIGNYGVFTVDQARDVAREHLRSMRMGTDPREVKKQDEAMKVTLRQVADAYFYERPGMLKESTLTEKDRHVEQVFAAFKDKPIASITESDCRKRYHEMATEGLRGKGPAPGQAQISMVTLSTLINFARRRYKRADGTPLIMHNPVTALKADWPGFKPRTRDIDERKVGAVWNLLIEASTNARYADARAGVDLVRFLLLTGARRMEGAALTWARVNLDEGWFYLPNPKNDNPVWIPLSSQTVAMLKARKPADDEKDASPYVFPSRSKGGHVMDTRAPLERISKLIDQPISAHDFRRTYVSVGVATLGIDLYKMELLTNHVPKGITARHYLKTSRLQYLQPEVQRIGDWMEAQGQVAAAMATGQNVVPLRA
jgi:integrase